MKAHFISLIACISGLTACGSATDPADFTTPEGAQSAASGALVVREADEINGKLTLDYTNHSRSIRYEMRLGPAMAEESAGMDEEASQQGYETDARVLDSDGKIIHMQMGGDAFVDSSWEMPILTDIDVAGRTLDFSLMQEATPLLRTARIPAALESLRLSAINLASAAPSVNDVREARAKLSTISARPDLVAVNEPGVAADPSQRLPSLTLPGSNVALQTNVIVGKANVALWDYQVWVKDVFPPGYAHTPNNKVGDHSAVKLRGFDSKGTEIFSFANCNHASCADTPTMTKKCTKNSYFRDDGSHSRYMYSERSSVDSSVQGGCSTNYSLASIANHHNCNDDSQFQMMAIARDSSASRSAGICSDPYTHSTAPSCSW